MDPIAPIGASTVRFSGFRVFGYWHDSLVVCEDDARAEPPPPLPVFTGKR